jgi:hypothetical protein
LEAADEEGCWWVGLSGERGVGFHCCGGFSGKPEAYLIEATVATNQQFSAAVTTEHNLINSRYTARYDVISRRRSGNCAG